MNFSITNTKRNIFNYLKENKKLLLCCLISSFLWGFIAHAYGFLHNNLSHDVLNAFTALPGEEGWKIELGRFFVPIYRMFFRGPLSLPWLIGIIGMFWLSLSVYLTVRLLKVENKILIILIAGLMVTNITLTSQIATYLYEFDFNALALLASIGAVTFWRTRNRWKQFLLAPLCLLLSLSIYQAYITVTVTLMIWLSLMDLLDQKKIRSVLIEGVIGIFFLLIGMLLYLFVGKLVYAVTGITPQPRTDMFHLNNILDTILSFFSLLSPTLTNLRNNIFHTAYPQAVLAVLFWSSTLLAFIQFIKLLIVKHFELTRSLLACLLLFILPLGMNCIYLIISGQGMHDLMCYASWFVYIFLLYFSTQINTPAMLSGRFSKAIRLLAYALTVFILFQNIVIANTCYVKKEMEATATLSTMTRVVAALEQHEDYHYRETTVAFIGADSSNENIYGFEKVDSITGMWSKTPIPADTSLYYYNVYKTYFDYVLNYPINLCSDEVHAQLVNDPRVQTLPSFPNANAIQMIDGVLVVKM